MKKILVVLTTLSLSAHLTGQVLMLLEDNKQWAVEYADPAILPPEIYQLHYEYEGDTIIGNTAYQQFGNGAILREDTIERKVYSFTGEAECLLYDFSAAPGDTIVLCEGIRIVIDSITQITSSDGLLRKQFHVSGDDAINLEYYIEGVGTNLGFVEVSEIIGPPFLGLMCVKKDGIEIFGNRCDEVVAVFHRDQPGQPVQAYPNPTHGVVVVEPAIAGLRMQILDVNGKLVLEGRLKGDELSIAHLNPGLYFLFFFDENGQCVGKERIVVVK